MSGSQSDGRRDRNAYDSPSSPPSATKPPAKKAPDDTVTLLVGGVSFTGWQDVRIVRGIELFPSHFVLRLTEKLPSQPNLFAIAPGQTCQVKIGADLVITGYVDTYEAQISTKGHEITVTGRSGTEDLVDCAAGVTPGEERTARLTFSAATLLQLAQDLCKPFGIAVSEPDGEPPPLVSLADGIPQNTFPLGVTVYDILEPYARERQLLLMDGTDGNLELRQVGTTQAASGFSLPGSVLEAQVRFSKQDRFTIYLPAYQATDQAMELPAAGGGSINYPPNAVRDDAAFQNQPRLDGQPRYRPHFVISSQIVGNLVMAEALADWEKRRRYGRSQAVVALVALWRDSAGTLWTPNTLAPVNMPTLKLKGLTWLITQVAYLKGFGSGTRTMVTLMPPEAFSLQPTIVLPFNAQISQALHLDTAPPTAQPQRDDATPPAQALDRPLVS